MHEKQVVSLDEYLALPAVQLSWIIPNLIPHNSFTVLWGPPKSGKTLLALSLGLAIANGTPWFGHRTTAHRVLLLELDMSQTLLRSTVSHLGTAPNLYLPHPEGLSAAYPVNLLTESSQLYLHSLVSEVQPHLVIVDCLAELGNHNENDEQGMKSIVHALKHVTTFHSQYPCACLLLHHTVKFDYQNPQHPIPSPLKAGRGSGYLAGAADSIWFLHRLTSDQDPNAVLKIVPRFTQPTTLHLRQGQGGVWQKVGL